MCGIFGIAVKAKSSYSTKLISNITKELAMKSQSRGKDSSGFCIINEVARKMHLIKGSIDIKSLQKTKQYKSQLNTGLSNYDKGEKFCLFGHARLVTNGSQLNHQNNQPVFKDGIVSIHNGIIVNTKQIWDELENREREYQIDTEVLNTLIDYNDSKNNGNTIKSVSSTVKKLHGTVSAAFLFCQKNELVLSTNNGSLYVSSNFKDILMFASEESFLNETVKKLNLKSHIPDIQTFQIKSNKGLILEFNKFKTTEFDFESKKDYVSEKLQSEYNVEIEIIERSQKIPTIISMKKIRSNPLASMEMNILEHNIDRIRNLKRCTKCVLPETFPFIEYDGNGVCNYCLNYKKISEPKSIENLQNIVNNYKKDSEKPDCIVPFSGGRDSTFTLHIVKKVLGLNPIALTYDWGMVTDLARRNIARVCGKLGVENIIVAADLQKKRQYIRKNVSAWLRRPSLGMIPLFMAGDKYFYYHTNELKKRTGIKLNIWGINNLETTHFKVGFAGIRPHFDKKLIFSLSTGNKFGLFYHIAENFLKNPSYLNSSLFDSLGSFFVRYRYPHKHYHHFFDYYPWDEKEVTDLIINEYNWETAIDTDSTWRIGDGTASFYNYIYYNVAGFSEIDTFRSNQIREGMISRDEALEFVFNENKPRYENLKWYLGIIGLDYTRVIERINKIPKLYQ